MHFSKLLGLVCAGLALGVAPARGFEIVSWNATRGGVSSLSDSTAYSSTRTMISTDFPGTTIVGVPTITTAALSGTSVVWIGSGFGDSSATTALSSSEQSALLAFVLGGGTAVLFGENDTFDPNAPTVNNSYYSAFGAHTTGTLLGGQAYTFPSPGSFPLTGPFGTVGSLSSSYPGWFDVLPASASVVADLSANGHPVITTLGPGALGTGSGPVWMFSDTGAQSAGGVTGTGWNTLYANILSQVPEPGSGGVLLVIGTSVVLRRR